MTSQDTQGDAPTRSTHAYQVHGLHVASSIELPELAPASPVPADVEIYVGEIPGALPEPIASGPYWQAGLDSFLFEIPGVARYLVTGGRSIRVAPDPACEEPQAVRLYLMGTGMGVLLHQRGLFVLHASAVETPSGAWLFTGPSGAGKSTLAAWLQQRHGWPLLSDDVTVIDTAPKTPTARRGPNRLRLWRDALAALSLREDGLARDLTRFDKFQLCTDATPGPAVPFRGLVLLESMESDGPATLGPLAGSDALSVLMGSVYRPEFAAFWRPEGALFMESASLARRITTVRFSRPMRFDDHDQHVSPLLAVMAGS
jgi:hypothetical protein